MTGSFNRFLKALETYIHVICNETFILAVVTDLQLRFLGVCGVCSLRPQIGLLLDLIGLSQRLDLLGDVGLGKPCH